MSGLDHADHRGFFAVAVAGHRQTDDAALVDAVLLPVEPARDRGHASAGLAGTEDDQPTRAGGGQMRHQAAGGMRGGDRLVEEAEKQAASGVVGGRGGSGRSV